MKKYICRIIQAGLIIYDMLLNSCQILDPIAITKFSPLIEPSNVSYTSATVKSQFMDIGEEINTYGHCWDTLQNPTIDDSKTVFSETPQKQVEFTSELDQLYSITKYYVRAYARTEKDTLYSNEINFSTIPLSDIDGNDYKLVKIGTQLWMAENLRTTKYNNGDEIGTTSIATLDIYDETEPKYQWAYDGNELNVITYGRLYTWYAATDSRSICPSGWHLPSFMDFLALEDYLTNNGYGYEGSGDDIAKSLASTSGWNSSSEAGTPGNDQASNNSSGFNAFPGGKRDPFGTFMLIGEVCVWWSTPYDLGWTFSYGSEGILTTNAYTSEGRSVRCLKD